MDSEIVINKILRDIKMEGLITDSNAPYLRKYINAAYASGYDFGRKKLYASNKKPVLLLNKNGDVIREFESAEEAARQMKRRVGGIYKSIFRKSNIHVKNYWRYKDEQDSRIQDVQ